MSLPNYCEGQREGVIGSYESLSGWFIETTDEEITKENLLETMVFGLPLYDDRRRDYPSRWIKHTGSLFTSFF